MSIKRPFAPHYGTNQVVSLAAGVAQSITLSNSDIAVNIANSGNAVLYARLSNAATTATTADFPVLPNQRERIEKMQDFTTLSLFSPVGTTVNVMTGQGGFN